MPDTLMSDAHIIVAEDVVASATGADETAWADRSAYWLEQAKPRPSKIKRRKTQEPLILSGHGVRLRIDRGTLLVRNGFTHYPQQREEWRFFPGHRDLPSRIIILDADGGLSFDVLAWLSTQAIPLVHINWRGEVITVSGSDGYAADPELVRAQLAACTNGTGLKLSRWLIEEKLVRSAITLSTSVPVSEARDVALRELERAANEIRQRPPQSLDALRGIEGRVAYLYFAAWRPIPVRWTGTGRRPIPDDWMSIGSRVSSHAGKNRDATHPVNALLNYAYAVLESTLRIAIVSAGLDPTIGNLHVPYRGRSALALDLMEPLRPEADQTVLSLIRQQAFEAADFTLRDDGVCRVNSQLARKIVREIEVSADTNSPVARLVRDIDQHR